MVTFRQPEITKMAFAITNCQDYRFGMAKSEFEMTRLKQAMDAKGLKVKDLAKLVGCKPPEVSRLANGGRKLTAEWAKKFAPHLGVQPAYLLFNEESVAGAEADLPADVALATVRDVGHSSPQQPYLGARDLPVYAAVEGGKGDLVVSTDPVDIVPRPWYLGEVKDGYGVIVTGESMVPAYEPGDIAIVNPRLPYMRGKVHIFTAESENSHFKAMIKMLVGVTDKEWKVEQYNPRKTILLPRNVWTNARRVVGKYNG